MRICYFDAFSGISGDMTVGSLLDAGADIGALNDALASLGLGASYRAEKTKRRGIAATKFHVDGGETKAHRHLHHIDTMIAGSSLPDAVKEKSLAVFRRLAEGKRRFTAQRSRRSIFMKSEQSIPSAISPALASVSINSEWSAFMEAR